MPSTPLIDPRAFYDQRTPSLLGAAVIIYLAGVTAVSTGAPFLGQVSEMEWSLLLVVFAILVGGAIGGATLWLVFTLVIYLLTTLVGGSGSFTRTAANVGWGLLPLLLANVVGSAIVWFLYLAGQLPTLTPETLQGPPWLTALNAITGIVAWLWVGYLFTYAIHDARDVPVRRAAAIAGIISLVNILYSVWTFV